MEIENGDSQSENFRCIPRLYAVTLTLSSISGNDAEVSTSNGENGTAILSVRIERMLLRSLGHCYHPEGSCRVEEKYGIKDMNKG
jgi:hypothetical protein